MTQFALAEKLDFHVLPIVRGEPLLQVDTVMQDWRGLRAAVAEEEFAPAPADGFPGLRAPLPGDYVRGLLRRLDPPVRRLFFPGVEVELARFECAYSLVTAAPQELSPAHKLPAADIAGAGRVAVVHYLCEPGFGGVTFYRQDATGLGRVGPESGPAWAAARAAELAMLPKEAGYPGEHLPGYTATLRSEARPDRLIAFRSNNIHAHVIDRPELLSRDPQAGRLTASFVLEYRPLAR